MMDKPEIKQRLQFLDSIAGYREMFLKRYSQTISVTSSIKASSSRN
jgi:hypothetical protein